MSYSRYGQEEVSRGERRSSICSHPASHIILSSPVPLPSISMDFFFVLSIFALFYPLLREDCRQLSLYSVRHGGNLGTNLKIYQSINAFVKYFLIIMLSIKSKETINIFYFIGSCFLRVHDVELRDPLVQSILIAMRSRFTKKKRKQRNI